MMNYFKFLTLICLLICISSCQPTQKDNTKLQSPNSILNVEFLLSKSGQPQYVTHSNNKTVIDTSSLGFQLKKEGDLFSNFSIIKTERSSLNETWQPIWGQENEITNNYNELKVFLEQTNNAKLKLNVIFRAFDDGVAFRYEFPEQTGLHDFVITDEKTQFNLTGDHKAWWIPADYDSYEYTYSTTKLSEVDAIKAGFEQRHDRNTKNIHAVNTPVTMKTEDGLYLSIHEADLTDYAGMTLGVTENNTLKAELVPWENGDLVRVSAPFKSPWRTIQIANEAKDLLASRLILNLNEPSTIEDASYIKPMKYNGIWWEIHIGKSSWDYGTGKHGATTENTKRYIDFASENNIKGVLVEGWNTGWDDWTNKEFSLTEPYPDFNIEEIVSYGKEKGVELIGHHETFGNVALYDSIVEDAFQYYHKLGIQNVKTGYAAGLKGAAHHHGQFMVRHYRKVIKLAAKYNINVDAHEPIKPTGESRTYPNFMTREGVRGMEFNAWESGNPPEHTTILPFTRILGGPIDYTPGIFDIKFEKYRKGFFVRSTLANQLALYVVLYSPMHMVADLPEHYEKEMPAFKFIKDVAVDWDKTVVLDAEIGEYLTIARKEKNTDNWFIGSITDEEKRKKTIALDFLDADKTYTATIYSDAEDAHWMDNPTPYKIEEKEVTNKSELELLLAPGGGTAISIMVK